MIFPLLLASASPRRLALLQQIGIDPALIFSPEIDETPFAKEKASSLALRLARAKAKVVVNSKNIILAADTVVVVGQRILGKPQDSQEALKMLQLLSGRRHRVITAVVLEIPEHKPRQIYRIVQSTVKFKRLSEQELEFYLASQEWDGKAGAYAIQGKAAQYIDYISGSYSNIVGLPLYETAQLLRSAGWQG